MPFERGSHLKAAFEERRHRLAGEERPLVGVNDARLGSAAAGLVCADGVLRLPAEVAVNPERQTLLHEAILQIHDQRTLRAFTE
jgi:hypothetical protein